MSLSFLPESVKSAIAHLNYNYLSEIRLRSGKPVLVEYSGAYSYLGSCGLSTGCSDRIVTGEVASVLNSATNGCIYGYTEQMKSGFITVEHGVRIGIAGEYVTDGGRVNTIKSITSLNIRIPHEIENCSEIIFRALLQKSLNSVLIFSKPGLGKTTVLRDIARKLSADIACNVLVFDERNEISGFDGFGEGFDLGLSDVVRCYCKREAIASAIRAMKPHVIITDELYGEGDFSAVRYASDCGIKIIASSHITDGELLKKLPFDYFAELKRIGGQPVLYDKNFNIISDNSADNLDRRVSVGK